MNPTTRFILAATLLLVAGCGSKPAGDATSDSHGTAPVASDTAAAPAAAAVLATSLYDQGPRAAAGPVDAAKAAAGETLFATKGCTACHGWGKKLTGPDLKGVTTRRTAAWMEHQIMEPDVMTRTDPISHGLMAQNNNLQMLNLHLTQTEAQNLIEYFKKLDKAK